MTDFIRDMRGVCLDRVGEKIALLFPCGGNSRLDLVHDAVDVWRNTATGDRGLHGAAVLVAHHDHESNSKGLDCVFDASEADVIHDVTRRPDNKEPVQVLAEDMLRGGSCVRAGDHDGDRGVGIHRSEAGVMQRCRGAVGVVDKGVISFFQQGQCRVGIDDCGWVCGMGQASQE